MHKYAITVFLLFCLCCLSAPPLLLLLPATLDTLAVNLILSRAIFNPSGAKKRYAAAAAATAKKINKMRNGPYNCYNQ